MRKGFSLVELSIVLVIIGILMGITMKGKSLIDSAMIKRELQKIYAVEVGFNAYYAQDGVYPNAPFTQLIASKRKVVNTDKLVADGFLNRSDIVTNLGVNVMIIRCKSTMRSDGKYSWGAVEDFEYSDVTYFPEEYYCLDPAPVGYDSRVACSYEATMDDQALYGGNGRHPTRDSKPVYNNFDYNNCRNASSVMKSIRYFIRIL